MNKIIYLLFLLLSFQTTSAWVSTLYGASASIVYKCGTDPTGCVNNIIDIVDIVQASKARTDDIVQNYERQQEEKGKQQAREIEAQYHLRNTQQGWIQ